MSCRTSWFLPDLAFVASCVTLFYCIFLFQGYQRLFRDSDAGWHIRTGEAILATGSLPHADPYSFTRAGQPWVAWEWGSDVITGAIHQGFGLRGVAMFYALAIAAGVWLWFRVQWVVGGDFLLACLMAPLLLSTCNLHWLARPHVLSWLFLLVAVWYAERIPRRGVSYVAVAAFSAVWANVHASFFLAALIGLVYAAGDVLRGVIWEEEGGLGGRRRPGACATYIAAAVAAVAGSLVNPYGFQLHRHVFAYLANSELLHRIGEFQTFDFRSEGAGQILLMLGLVMAGGVLALTRRRPEHFLLCAMFTAMAVQSARALPLAALVGLPLANGAITGALRSARDLRIRLPFEYSSRLRALDAGLGGLAWAPLVVAAFWLTMPRADFPADQFPVAAVSHVPETARLLAPDKFGGYLIYRGRKVFFDGRSDFYGVGFLKEYGRLVQVRPGWQDILAKFRFTHALLPTDYSLVPALQARGWKVTYSDRTAILLEAP